jgi:hypothetical protein
MPAGVPTTAVSETGDMANEDLVGSELMAITLGQRDGGWVIHLPAVV